MKEQKGDRHVNVCLSLEETIVKRIDETRGLIPRSVYVNHLLKAGMPMEGVASC